MSDRNYITVAELITILQGYAPDLPVYIHDQEGATYPINWVEQGTETETEYTYKGEGFSRIVYATAKNSFDVVYVHYTGYIPGQEQE